MKICAIVPRFTLGRGHPTNFFFEYLARKHKVTLITSPVLPGEGPTKMKIIRLKSLVIGSKFIMPEMVPTLMDIDADVFHLYGYRALTSWIGMCVAKIRSIPTVLSMDWNPDTGLVNPGLKFIYDNIFSVPTLRSDFLTVYTEERKKDLIDFGVDEEKILIIPNGVDYRKYSRVKRNEKAKQRLGLDPKNRIILSVARISPEKNLEFLIKAFSIVKKRNKNVKLLIVGPKATLVGKDTSSYYINLEKLVRRLKLSDDVIFYGPIKHKYVYKAFASGDIFALSSKYESFGNVLLQATSSGLPLVSTKIGVAPHLVKQGCGFATNDLKRYALHLDKLLKNSRLRQRIGKRSKEVAKKFSWPEIVLKYEEAYEKALS